MCILKMVNPDCAFNATGFLLEIYNRWGQKVFTHKSPKDTECCKFNAPGGKINPSYSSIFWNGQTGEMLNGQWVFPANGGPIVSDGEYVVSLTLYACNGVEKLYKLESLFVQTN